MKKSRFTEQQIAFALKQAELGTPVEEVCRKVANAGRFAEYLAAILHLENKRLGDGQCTFVELPRAISDHSVLRRKENTSTWL